MPHSPDVIKPPIAIDAHVHVYPIHDPVTVLESALGNLDEAVSDRLGPRALLLTERSDCDFFEEISSGGPRLPEGWAAEITGESCSMRLRSPAGRIVYLIAGRQAATAERLEVLALGTRERFSDGGTCDETLSAVRESGALPVLCWSPGKWLFERGKIVERLLNEAAASGKPLCVADSALRPVGWGRPWLLRLARRSGLTCLAGSDPLPLPREERRVGGFGMASTVPVDDDHPFRSISDIMTSGAFEIVGDRLSPWEMAARLYRLGKQRRAP